MSGPPRALRLVSVLLALGAGSAGSAQSVTDPRQPTAEVVEVLERAPDGGGPAAALRLHVPIVWADGEHRSAVWLTLRGEDPRAAMLRLDPTRGATCTGETEDGHRVDGRVRITADGSGAFVECVGRCRDAVRWQVSLPLAETPERSVTAWPVDMVHVAAGSFLAGDDHPLAVRFGSFHTRDADGGVGGPLWIDDESALRVGEEVGALWYETDDYRGDQAGPVPDSFPKGTEAFYVMRRELTQGQYAAWLEALPAECVAARAPTGLEGEDTSTCSIRRADDGRWFAEVPSRPCNFVSWDDTAAWLDWHGLRPMTELEFEKAARGPRRPVPLDYPWGTASTENVRRVVAEDRSLEFATLARERDFDGRTRETLAGSHYGAFDLAGSLWERVVSLGHPRGRAFEGSHGDGRLSPEGRATNEDWPSGDEEGRTAPGIGYRGGAEYFAEPRPDNPTNPFSPVAVRTYGAWDGAYRYKTYSARGVRSAPPAEPLGMDAAEWFPRRMAAFLRTAEAARAAASGMEAGPQRERARATLAKIDAEGSKLVALLLDRVGWPRREEVGEAVAAATLQILLREGTEASLLERALPGVHAAFERGEVAGSDLAELVDRLRVAQQRPQVYGVVLVREVDAEGRETVRGPVVEAIGGLDARRASLGLEPWATWAAAEVGGPVPQPRAWDGRWPVARSGG